MSLSPAFLDELRSRTLLSALIGRSTKLQKAGREWRACCPFHNEKTPSFYVNDDKGFYHCFGCSAHGDAIRWMTDQRGLPFIDAVKELAQSAGMEIPAMDPRAAEKAEAAKGLHEACADAAAWFTEQLNGLSGATARDVMAKRGIKPETARAFGLGFAPDSRSGLKTALKEYGDPLLVEAGLLIKVEDKAPYDRFRGRLMIPIRDPRGRTIAFGGRIIGDGEPKYLNSPETPLFDKGRTLYNLDRAAPASRKAGRLIVVEGYMDVIALAGVGIDEVVAPNGTAVTEAQLERMWRLSDVPIICLDGDPAGQAAAIRAAHRALPLLSPGRSLAFVTLPQGQDPDDLVRHNGAGPFEALLTHPTQLIDKLWLKEINGEQGRTPEARAKIGSNLRTLAKTIRDDGIREDYLATFNQSVWDHFHPERPSASFRTGKKQEDRRPVSERVRAIAKHGIDEVTMVPAALKGLVEFPDLIAPLAELIVRLPIKSPRLRMAREIMLDAALSDDALESERLRAILRDEGRADVLAQMDKLTLAFSFIAHNGDAASSRNDLIRVIEKLAYGRELDVEIDEMRETQDSWSAQDFEKYAGLVKARLDIEESFKNEILAAYEADEYAEGS